MLWCDPKNTFCGFFLLIEVNFGVGQIILPRRSVMVLLIFSSLGGYCTPVGIAASAVVAQLRRQNYFFLTPD
jgi:hypothetical protein